MATIKPTAHARFFNHAPMFPPPATVTREDLIAARDDAEARFARDGVETDAELARIVGAELDRE